MRERLSLTIGAALIAALVTSITSFAAEALVLAEDGKSIYQIVIPDASPDQAVEDSLKQTARLVQTAFKQSDGSFLPIVKERDRDPNKPCIFLGNSAFAQEHGVDVDKLEGWSYVMKVVGPDLVIAGRDHAPPEITDPELKAGRRARFFYRLATLKGVCDFLRDYLDVYFLFPGNGVLPSENSKKVREWNLTDNANIEYGNKSKVSVPADLDVHKDVFILSHVVGRSSLYDVANNYFPRVDAAALGHTHEKAVPPKKYREDHPEYFAVIGGERTKTHQYCISNSEFQELLFRWAKSWLDAGFRSVNLLQSDGFHQCACPNCAALYGVGEDWAEKVWILHLKTAERLQKTNPDGKVALTAYAFAQEVPKSYDKLPDNVIIQNVDACNHTTETFEKWFKLHKGEYSSGNHNWIPVLASRFTPMRTPLFLGKQVKWFHEHNIRSVFKDGFNNVFGLEGPSYYIFGRMFDDPENLTAKDLIFEYCQAAFGESASDMRRFYDRLYHAIELYSSYLGTHNVGWGYTDIYGRRHKHLRDPFRFLGFLYTPKILNELEANLSKAEKKAKGEKVKLRLALVRREFDYLKAMMKVIHLYHAYKTQPDKGLRDRLLDAIDDRNELIATYYVQEGNRKGRMIPMPGWDTLLFPPPGHTEGHLRLKYNSYGEPFADTAFNWDTDAMREAPLPGSTKLEVKPVSKTLYIDSKEWERIAAVTLGGLPANAKPAKSTALKVARGPAKLYLLVEAELDDSQTTFASAGEDGDLDDEESIDVYVAPVPGQELYYRFKVGPNPESKFDAANGLIEDKLNLLYGRDDTSWNGEWTYATDIDPKTNRWSAMLAIPYETMGVKPPQTGDYWKLNVARNHPTGDEKMEKSIWSLSGSAKDVSNKESLGDVEFAAPGKIARWRAWRETHCAKTFDLPKTWKAMPNRLPEPLGPWKIRVDALERGVPDEWFAMNVDESQWQPVEVPGFWAESGVNHEGYAWYRTTFKVPAEWKGKALRIMFGSADEQAWVYVNGKLVKEHTCESENAGINELWEDPFHADVKPEDLNYGGDNVLAVRVLNMKANGGLWRPVIACAVEPE